MFNTTVIPQINGRTRISKKQTSKWLLVIGSITNNNHQVSQNLPILRLSVSVHSISGINNKAKIKKEGRNMPEAKDECVQAARGPIGVPEFVLDSIWK